MAGQTEKRTVKKRRNWIWIVVVVIVLACAGAAIMVNRARNQVLENLPQSGDVVEATLGDLAESASASGQIVAGREADLSLATSGTVRSVLVEVGDTVAAGDLLVQLDDAALQRNVATAEQDLIIAQANLATLYEGASAAQIASAEASVASAQAALADLQAGPSATEIAASEASLRAAEANLLAAQDRLSAAATIGSQADILSAEASLTDAQEQQRSAYDTWVRVADCEEDGQGGYNCTLPDSDFATTVNLNLEAANANLAAAEARLAALRSPNSSSVASAQAGVASSQAQLDSAQAAHESLLLGASESEIAAAEADLAQARATLAGLMAGPAGSTITSTETRLAQAQTGLDNARNALAEAALVAPFGGIVTDVYVSVGEQASGVAVTLVDTSSYEVVLHVDEVDIGALALGQAANVTLESFPDETIASEIVAIAPNAATGSDGIVSFEVRLGLATAEVPLRVGMTANAALITAERENVLLVPNAAITADRENGKFYVNRLTGTDENGVQQFEQVEVTIGLRDDDNTNVVSGLSIGDQVLVGQLATPTFDFGGGPFGGGD